MWIMDYYYPCYPKKLEIDPLEDYFSNLQVGSVFAYNNDSPKLTIVEFKKIKKGASILVYCERDSIMCEHEGFFPWSIFEITHKNDSLVHSKLGSYLEVDDADNAFLLLAGS